MIQKILKHIPFNSSSVGVLTEGTLLALVLASDLTGATFTNSTFEVIVKSFAIQSVLLWTNPVSSGALSLLAHSAPPLAPIVKWCSTYFLLIFFFC